MGTAGLSSPLRSQGEGSVDPSPPTASHSRLPSHAGAVPLAPAPSSCLPHWQGLAPALPRSFTAGTWCGLVALQLLLESRVLPSKANRPPARRPASGQPSLIYGVRLPPGLQQRRKGLARSLGCGALPGSPVSPPSAAPGEEEAGSHQHSPVVPSCSPLPMDPCPLHQPPAVLHSDSWRALVSCGLDAGHAWQ